MQTALEYTPHARQQMQARGVSEADVDRVCRDFVCFANARDYAVNLWGRDCVGRPLRITVVPEIRLVMTVAEVECVSVGEMLAAKR